MLRAEPGTVRLITGKASESSHMLAINSTLDHEAHTDGGMWERRHGALG